MVERVEQRALEIAHAHLGPFDLRADDAVRELVGSDTVEEQPSVLEHARRAPTDHEGVKARGMRLLGQAVEGPGPPAAEIIWPRPEDVSCGNRRRDGVSTSETAHGLCPIEPAIKAMQHALPNQRSNDLIRCRSPEACRQLVERHDRAALALERDNQLALTGGKRRGFVD